MIWLFNTLPFVDDLTHLLLELTLDTDGSAT